MEIVIVKVRPFYHDKKLHVLRFLFLDGEFDLDLIKTKLHDLFPYGFYRPVIERFMIDYVFEKGVFSSQCNHDYLAKYLISNIKLE